MADDSTARIDPAILAAALREVEGVDLDPSTDSGAIAAGLIVQRVLQDKDSMQRLLDVVLRLEMEALGDSIDYPQEFGPVVTSSEAFPDLLMATPPIGSEEFEQYMDELVQSDELRSSAKATNTRTGEPSER